MSGGSKTQTTTTSQTRDPWAPAQPALNGLIAGATNAFNSGVGSQVYQGDRTAGIGDTTQAGLDSMASNANGASGATSNGTNYLASLLGNGGTTTSIQNALQGLMGVQGVDTSGVATAANRMASPTSGANTVGNALIGRQYALDGTGYKSLADQLGTGTQTQRSLQDTADGKFLSQANPYTTQMIAQGAGDASSSVAQKFASSGRYGSGRFAGAVADATDRVGTQLRYQDYDAERARQVTAAGAIDSAANARTGVQSGLLDSQNNVRSQNAGQAVTGAGLTSSADAAALSGQNTLANLVASNNAQQLGQYGAALSSGQSDRAAAQGGLGQISTVQDALNQPGKTLAGVGAIQDAARQQELDSQQSVFDEQQQSPWKQLGLYSSIVDPIAGMGGQTNGTETKTIPQASLLQQVLGGAAAATGILGQTGAFPAAAKGASSAGWLSALPALFSDERLKDDIEPIGATFDGQPIYRYRMKGDGRMQIGLMAHEVAGQTPDAVIEGPGGFLMVNYALATERAARMGATGGADNA